LIRAAGFERPSGEAPQDFPRRSRAARCRQSREGIVAIDPAQKNALPARAALTMVKSDGCCEGSGYADLSELESSEAQDRGARVDSLVRRSCHNRQTTTPVRQPTPNPITSTAIEINI
jgi:hypothetical protein